MFSCDCFLEVNKYLNIPPRGRLVKDINNYEGEAQINLHVIEIESEWSNCFSINLPDVKNLTTK